MVNKPLARIFDDGIIFKGAVADYSDIDFNPELCAKGDFTLRVNAHTKYAAYLIPDNIIYIDSEISGWIMSSEVVRGDGAADEILEVKGIQTKDILSFRLTDNNGAPFTYTNKSPEYIVKDLIAKNIGASCADTSRIYNKVVVAANLDRGTAIDFQTYNKNLAEEIYSVLQADGLGLKATLNVVAKTLTFDVVQGVDRTAEQSTNNRVLLGIELGGLNEIKYLKDKSQYKNVAYVGGQGEGEDRNIQKIVIDSPTGIQRREVFIDARDINEVTELDARGKQKLAGYALGESVDCVIRDGGSYSYGVHYGLGDYVTIVDDLIGIQLTAQATGAKIKWRAKKPVSVEVNFGYKSGSIEASLKRRLAAAETAIVAGGGAPARSGLGYVLAKKSAADRDIDWKTGGYYCGSNTASGTGTLSIISDIALTPGLYDVRVRLKASASGTRLSGRYQVQLNSETDYTKSTVQQETAPAYTCTVAVQSGTMKLTASLSAASHTYLDMAIFKVMD